MASSKKAPKTKIWSWSSNNFSCLTRFTTTYETSPSSSSSISISWYSDAISHALHMIERKASLNLILVLNVSSRLSPFFIFLWILSAVLIPVSAMDSQYPLSRKRCLAESLSSTNETQMSGFESRKRLRRLPHVFNRVLELPIKSDADVSIEISPSHFRFVVDVSDNGVCGGGGRVRAHVIQVIPGVVKVVVKGPRGDQADDDDDELLQLDKWRFRLPVTTRPECAMAVCIENQLVVTVPKDPSVVDGDVSDTWSGIDQLIEVQ